MKLLYIHGFSSSGASTTGIRLAELLPECELIAPDLPEYPEPALQLLRSICEVQEPDLICGSSMGGMYAQHLRGYKKILINPAFYVSQVINQYMDMRVYYYRQRKDPSEKDILITPHLQQAFMTLEQEQFVGITPRDVSETIALFATHDEIVDNRAEYLQYYTQYRIFEGGHLISREAVEEVLLPTALDLLQLSR